MLARIRQLTPFQLDLLIAGGLLLVGQVDALLESTPDRRLAAALVVAVQAAALAWRRHRPVMVAAIVVGAQVAASGLGLPSNGLLWTLLAIIVAMYGAGAQRSLPGAGAGLAIGAVGVTAAVIASGKAGSDVGFGLLVVTVPWAIGRAMQGRGRRIERLQSEQEELTRQAVSEERAHIARELHDMVAHSMAVMVVQAQGAERMLDAQPERARQALRQIEETGRDALIEMHRLVGILREASGGDGLAPQGSLRQLDALVEQARSAGLQVGVERSGDLEGLSPGPALAAYRIVQESLTNSLKHGGRSAKVAVAASSDCLRIRIDDEGGGRTAPAVRGGHGLVGMRERVRLYGGSFNAGRRPDGGFSVVASLPLP